MHEDVLAWMISIGYQRRDEGGRHVRPTLRGAFLMTSRLIWPIGRMRTVLQRGRAARTIRSLNLNG